jgi:hypothetical protein
MSYVNGPMGFQGYQGPQGLQGRQGYCGPAFGPTGPDFSSSPKLNVLTPTTTTITLPLETALYNVVKGSSTVIVPSVSVAYPNPEQSGIYWTFKNNSTLAIVLTFGGGYTTTYSLSVGQCITLIAFIDGSYNVTYSLL